MMRLFLIALGAKVGARRGHRRHDMGAADLLAIGAGASIGGKVKFDNARVEGNEFIIGPIAIGADCLHRHVLRHRGGRGDRRGRRTRRPHGHRVRQPGRRLRDLGRLAGPPGRHVDAAELWQPFPRRPRRAVAAQGLVYTALLLVVPPLGLLPIFPAFWVFDQIDDWLTCPTSTAFAYLASLPLLAWPTAFVMVLVTVAFIAAIRWIVLPRVEEGTYSVHSWFYVRKWMVALATEITLDMLTSLFATVYMRGWYRLMGAKIGKDAEISTNLAGRYDLVEIGEKCFIADEVVLGDEEIRRGWMNLKRVRTGARVFIGNDGVVPIGADIPDGALIGIKSKPPANEADEPRRHLVRHAAHQAAGAPALRRRRRQLDLRGAALEEGRCAPCSRRSTSRCRRCCSSCSAPGRSNWLGPKVLDGDYWQVAVLFVLVSVAISVVMTAVVIVIKWVTMGRYEPTTQPMWSWWAMRTEAVAVMYWGLAGKVLLDHLRGTPFLPWVLRLFGAKFGKGVYMDMTDITEFDCVTVGDFVSINALSALQTHLYEDRVMKVGRVAHRRRRDDRRRLDGALRHPRRRLSPGSAR